MKRKKRCGKMQAALACLNSEHDEERSPVGGVIVTRLSVSCGFIAGAADPKFLLAKREPLPTPGVCHGRGQESQQARDHPQ
jgi:hypothetical protein